MAGSGRSSLLFVLLILMSVCVVPSCARAATGDTNPYLTEKQVFLSTDFDGHEVIKYNQTLNATDYYWVGAQFTNLRESHQSLSSVFNVVMILDSDGYTTAVGANTYGDQNITGGSSSQYVWPWTPILPGNYTVKTFLISGWERPQSISNSKTFHVMVKEKIDRLGEGEGNWHLKVESINLADDSVKVIYNYCNDTYPYTYKAPARLSLGEFVKSFSVNAYFLGIEEGKAVFRYVANGGEFPETCLV